MIQYSPGVSAGIKMSDATLHDAHTHPLPARLMPWNWFVWAEKSSGSTLVEELGTRIPECLRLVGWLFVVSWVQLPTEWQARGLLCLLPTCLDLPLCLPTPSSFMSVRIRGTYRYFQVHQGTRGYSKPGDEYSYHPLVGMGSPLPGILPGGVLLCTLHHSCEDNVTIGGTVGTRQDYWNPPKLYQAFNSSVPSYRKLVSEFLHRISIDPIWQYGRVFRHLYSSTLTQDDIPKYRYMSQQVHSQVPGPGLDPHISSGSTTPSPLSTLSAPLTRTQGDLEN